MIKFKAMNAMPHVLLHICHELKPVRKTLLTL